MDRIAEGQFYEAHQQLRVIAARYTKQSNWAAAIDVLASGALALLQAGQGGSGGDLGILLIDTLNKGDVDVGTEVKGEDAARGDVRHDCSHARYVDGH